MRAETIEEAESVAREFLRRAELLRACNKPFCADEQRDGKPTGHTTYGDRWSGGCAETSALRRQSMELTRALAKLRKS